MAEIKITAAVGLRHARVLVLDTDGYPDGDQSGANGYDGVRVSGVQSLSLNVPDVQAIPHLGDDRVFAQDYLPPNTLPTAALNTGKTNFALDDTLVGTKTEAVGDGSMSGMITDKQGREVDVCLIAYRQALEVDDDDAPTYGSRRWQAWILPKTRMIPKGSSAEQGGADQNAYNLIPTNVKAAPWGKQFSEADNGFTEAVLLKSAYEYPPILERYTGNGTLDTFNVTKTPISVAKTKVYVNGTPATVDSVDTNAKTFTLNAAPANSSKVVAWYETTDSLS